MSFSASPGSVLPLWVRIKARWSGNAYFGRVWVVLMLIEASRGVLRSPQESSGVFRSPQGSSGVLRNVVGSSGVLRSLEESSGVLMNLVEFERVL